MATGDATWSVGYVTVPGSSGTVAVTGLGGTPSAVFFFGTNWLTEDTPVTSAGCGVFRGMAAPDYASPSTIVNSSACVLPSGNAFHLSESLCMNMVSTAGLVVDASSFAYVAAVDSFDGDGFTVDFQVVNSSGYKVVYAALMQVPNTAGFVGAINQSSLSLGWKAGASMFHGAWTGAAPSAGSSQASYNFYGGAAYPTTTDAAWKAAHMEVHTDFGAPGGQQFVQVESSQPTVSSAIASSKIGPFLTTANLGIFPVGSPMDDFEFAGEASNVGMVVAWDDEDSLAGTVSPGVTATDTSTVSGLPFRPGLVVGYTVSDEAETSSPDGRGGAGFSVVTPDFQWCATVDGVSSYGAYQSFQRGFCDALSGTDIHAGTVELTADGFVMTTVEDDFGPADMVWQAFGHPQRQVIWIPQIYRRIYGPDVVPGEPIATVISKPGTSGGVGTVGSGTSYVFYGFVLLENGDQIILEDGSGFLLL